MTSPKKYIFLKPILYKANWLFVYFD